MDKAKALQARRKQRVRSQIRRRKNDRPRLSVFRSGKNISAQVIDDRGGSTIVAASSLEKEIRGSVKSGGNKDAAAAVGKLLAERAVSKGLNEGCVRPRRVSVSRSYQGARRSRARSRIEVLGEFDGTHAKETDRAEINDAIVTTVAMIWLTSWLASIGSPRW